MLWRLHLALDILHKQSISWSSPTIWFRSQRDQQVKKFTNPWFKLTGGTSQEKSLTHRNQNTLFRICAQNLKLESQNSVEW